MCRSGPILVGVSNLQWLSEHLRHSWTVCRILCEASARQVPSINIKGAHCLLLAQVWLHRSFSLPYSTIQQPSNPHTNLDTIREYGSQLEEDLSAARVGAAARRGLRPRQRGRRGAGRDGRLRRGPSVIFPPAFSFIWRIPIRGKIVVTNDSAPSYVRRPRPCARIWRSSSPAVATRALALYGADSSVPGNRAVITQRSPLHQK